MEILSNFKFETGKLDLFIKFYSLLAKAPMLVLSTILDHSILIDGLHALLTPE